MYALIKLVGHQHKVEKDMFFLTEKTGHSVGDEFDCTDVLLLKKDTETKIGKPLVNGAFVKLKVLEEIKAPKIIGFKYKKRKGYRRHWGHRQNLQKLQVLSIQN